MKREDTVKKEWMTPDELAQLTGYSRQTINKWIKRQGWITSPKPGVQGGKARLIHIDNEVEEFLQSVSHVSEPIAKYGREQDPLYQLLMNSLEQMSGSEKQQIMTILLREGIKGLLKRLNIDDKKE